MKSKKVLKEQDEKNNEEKTIYRLRHLQFYNKKRGVLSKMCIDIKFDCFCAPNSLVRESVFKILSYLSDCIYKQNDQYERESIYCTTALNIILSNKKSGFIQVEESKCENIIDLFVVSGNLKKVERNKKYKNYFDWYIPGVTKEEVKLIYKNCGLEYEDLIVDYDTDNEYNDEKIDFGVLAVPCRHSFIVADDKAGALKNVKPNLEIRKENERLLSRVNNVTDLTNKDVVESEKVYVKKLK